MNTINASSEAVELKPSSYQLCFLFCSAKILSRPPQTAVTRPGFEFPGPFAGRALILSLENNSESINRAIRSAKRCREHQSTVPRWSS